MSATTRKCNCAETLSQTLVDENFIAARGFSLYDLPITYDGSEAETLTWDTITPDSDFRAALRCFETVAVTWLEDGTANHYCI